MDAIERIAEAIEETSPFGYLETLDPKRPYDGQAWTVHGERGRLVVQGLTTRDIQDCFIVGCFQASGLSPLDYPKSVYALPWDEMDPEAVAQNMCCEIERRMGVFPNIANLPFEEVMDQTPMIDLED